jgi:diadenosine tetraphosphatase ApaH/serine/threonine PP2A family protein phosphatase
LTLPPDGGTIRHPHPGNLRVARFGRGPGKPDCEPSEARQTEVRNATNDDAGGDAPHLGAASDARRTPLLGSTGMRIAVLSDIHANLPALDAVLTAAGDVDAVWQLGDVVGYGPDPDGVVDRLRSIGAIGVRGNHDAAACGGTEIESFNTDARRAMEWTRSTISRATRDWLAALPERLSTDGVELVHGSPRDPMWEYVLSREAARANLALLAAPIGLHGHTHLPVAWIDDGHRIELVRPSRGESFELGDRRALINPGSVGQPRDGDPAASYLILDPERGQLQWHRVTYDIAAVQAAMRAAGLPPGLAARLSVGL